MAEVAADPVRVVINVEGGFEGSPKVNESDVLMNPVADAWSAASREESAPKKLPGNVRKRVSTRVAARFEKKRKGLARQIFDAMRGGRRTFFRRAGRFSIQGFEREAGRCGGRQTRAQRLPLEISKINQPAEFSASTTIFSSAGEICSLGRRP